MADHTGENLTNLVNSFIDQVRAHDSIHPNRDVCGGVGGCRLMMNEVETSQEITELLERIAARPAHVKIEIVKLTR